MIVESALYLLLNHINLYSVIVDTSPDEDREIQSLKSKVGENLTPNFFSKVQHNNQVSFSRVARLAPSRLFLRRIHSRRPWFAD